MAEDLKIKKCWFHNSRWPHYDIPKKRIDEIQAKVEVVSSKELLSLIKDSEKRNDEIKTGPEED